MELRKSSVLNSWKEVSAYLGAGVRTVQRWEKDLGMPVHRPSSTLKRGPVIAYSYELDGWVHRPKDCEKVAKYLSANVGERSATHYVLRKKTNSMHPRLREQEAKGKSAA